MHISLATLKQQIPSESLDGFYSMSKIDIIPLKEPDPNLLIKFSSTIPSLISDESDLLRFDD